MLTQIQLAERKGKLTASRVACLMAGDTQKIMDLWLEMTGQKEEDDLFDVWPVRLGEATEKLQLDWYELKTGAWVSQRGKVCVKDWAACTLDGWIDSLHCPIECKHVGGREPLETIIERYQPQMHWQMIVTGAEQCALSVIMGANEPLIEFVPRDDVYGIELWRRGAQFMDCVFDRKPPVVLDPVAAPIDPAKVYDFTGNNAWSWAAADWLENKNAADKASAAVKLLKGLVPEDAKKCTGHGVRITRDRAGRLSLRAE